MIIDSYSPDWIETLDRESVELQSGKSLFVLLDGAFLPGLWRDVAGLLGAGKVELLFERRTPCNDEIRDISPVILMYEPNCPRLAEILARCSGQPMLSAIVTTESRVELAERLSAWCVVENDNQRFNLRFADTRRLPDIFEVLTPTQQAAFTGYASSWKYIGRDGRWTTLSLATKSAQVKDPPQVLDDAQFRSLVKAAEPDEVIRILLYRDGSFCLKLSEVYLLVREALAFPEIEDTPTTARAEWCGYYINSYLKVRDKQEPGI